MEVKDRRFRLKTYPSCFVGAEAVDYMVTSKIAESRQDAVRIGKALAREFFLFEHVTKEHLFEDKYLFYRFSDVPLSRLFSKVCLHYVCLYCDTIMCAISFPLYLI